MGSQIIDVVSFMPERRISNESIIKAMQFDSEKVNGEGVFDNVFFRGVKERRFASPDYSSEDLGSLALEKLLKKTSTLPTDLDMIICTCILNDTFWPGVGTAIQHRVGAKSATMLNFETSCCSYLSGLNTASAFINSGQCKKIALITITNFISRLPELQKSQRSLVLGDGASATLIASGDETILSHYERSHGENYGLLQVEPDETEESLNYWDRGCGPMTINFTLESIDKIKKSALELVPNAILRSIASTKYTPEDISLLITHQPNSIFLEEWRSRTGIKHPYVHDTLEHYGNLFQSSIPVTLADALEQEKVKRSDLLALGAFSNGGDFVSAMTLKWR